VAGDALGRAPGFTQVFDVALLRFFDGQHDPLTLARLPAPDA
jgi:hypothetical protein